MLVLSRKEQQQIVLDGGITITVVRVQGGAVRLGIDAPKEVPIRRAELLDAMETAALRAVR
jgi:carbon storage regulator